MAGLRNICKQFGRMQIQGRMWVWDYVNNEPVPEEEMRKDPERREANEKARAEWLRAQVQHGDKQ